jgi:hypothetical protein
MKTAKSRLRLGGCISPVLQAKRELFSVSPKQGRDAAGNECHCWPGPGIPFFFWSYQPGQHTKESDIEEGPASYTCTFFRCDSHLRAPFKIKKTKKNILFSLYHESYD